MDSFWITQMMIWSQNIRRFLDQKGARAHAKTARIDRNKRQNEWSPQIKPTNHQKIIIFTIWHYHSHNRNGYSIQHTAAEEDRKIRKKKRKKIILFMQIYWMNEYQWTNMGIDAIDSSRNYDNCILADVKIIGGQ